MQEEELLFACLKLVAVRTPRRLVDCLQQATQKQPSLDYRNGLPDTHTPACCVCFLVAALAFYQRPVCTTQEADASDRGTMEVRYTASPILLANVLLSPLCQFIVFAAIGVH